MKPTYFLVTLLFPDGKRLGLKRTFKTERTALEQARMHCEDDPQHNAAEVRSYSRSSAGHVLYETIVTAAGKEKRQVTKWA